MKLREPDLMTSMYHQRTGNSIYIRKDSASVSTHHTTIFFNTTATPEGVHIEPHGRLTINHSGDRDPDIRNIYQREFGVGCDLASNFAGMLVCPHTGRDVKVSRIIDNPVLWLDYEHGIAVKNCLLQYSTPTSPPVFMQSQYNVGHDVMHYSFANQKRHNAFKKHWAALRPEALLRYEIMGSQQIGWPHGKVKDLILAHPEATTLEQLCDLAKGMEGFHPDDFARMYQVVMILKTWDIKGDQAKDICADHYETTYFKIKEAA